MTLLQHSIYSTPSTASCHVCVPTKSSPTERTHLAAGSRQCSRNDAVLAGSVINRHQQLGGEICQRQRWRGNCHHAPECFARALACKRCPHGPRAGMGLTAPPSPYLTFLTRRERERYISTATQALLLSSQRNGLGPGSSCSTDGRCCCCCCISRR